MTYVTAREQLASGCEDWLLHKRGKLWISLKIMIAGFKWKSTGNDGVTRGVSWRFVQFGYVKFCEGKLYYNYISAKISEVLAPLRYLLPNVPHEVEANHEVEGYPGPHGNMSYRPLRPRRALVELGNMLNQQHSATKTGQFRLGTVWHKRPWHP